MQLISRHIVVRPMANRRLGETDAPNRRPPPEIDPQIFSSVILEFDNIYMETPHKIKVACSI